MEKKKKEKTAPKLNTSYSKNDRIILKDGKNGRFAKAIENKIVKNGPFRGLNFKVKKSYQKRL